MTRQASSVECCRGLVARLPPTVHLVISGSKHNAFRSFSHARVGVGGSQISGSTRSVGPDFGFANSDLLQMTDHGANDFLNGHFDDLPSVRRSAGRRTVVHRIYGDDELDLADRLGARQIDRAPRSRRVAGCRDSDRRRASLRAPALGWLAFA